LGSGVKPLKIQMILLWIDFFHDRVS
jgi:hypothetical protein